jgi:hypothetical protein
MDEHEDEYGKPLFTPVESNTIILNLLPTNETDEGQGVFSHTDMIRLCYGYKGIVINEIEVEDFSWLEV